MILSHFPAGALVTLLLVMLLSACREAPPTRLNHDAYVWQQRWQAPVASALRESADLVRAWRILAGEVDARGRFRRIAVDLAAVAASGRPAIPVIRIAAPLAAIDSASIITAIAALQRDWLASPATTTGLEIDHDCGTRQLANYGRFLASLRQTLARDQPLSMTLLPDWLTASELDALLAPVDETVLQLHAITNPAGVLFDPASAKAWTAALARRTRKPFRVALPNYGSRIVSDENGRITAIESEVPLGEIAGVSRELFAAPASVAAFLRQLEGKPPPRLSGIVWFRLPVAGDQRAWTPATWRAVITRKASLVRLVGEIRRDGVQDQQTLLLRNVGEMDSTLPATLVAKAPCRGSRGKNGYILEQRGDDSVFLRTRKALLRAGSEVAVGALNCPQGADHISIEQ